MSRRLNRFGLLLACLLASEVWALGLGDIRLNSALNEPLRAEIELLSATPEELANLRINLASVETFERYGIDRPLFLSRLNFQVTRVGGRDVITVTSDQPITEPFVTFLVEAVWSRGRLLREYTVLLDPPTFAPTAEAPRDEAVVAPTQSSQSDRGTIQRQQPRPSAPSPRPASAADTAPFDTTAGGDYAVRRGDTLWRIAERVRPDNRLTMNQVMLAIYEANPGAFAGNINVLRANAQLRIPSADEIFRISRGEALSEIRRQNQAWSGDAAGGGSQPTLTLVPPDGEQAPYQGSQAQPQQGAAASSASGERIRQLEDTIAEQESLLEIRDNELAQLRSELARLREERAQGADAGEVADTAAAPPAETAADSQDDTVSDEIFVDDSDSAAADAPAATDVTDTAEQPPATPAPRVATTPRAEEPGLVDTIVAALTSIWGLIGAALLVVLGVLAWFARRASGDSGDADPTGVWEALDEDDSVGRETHASTEQLRTLAREDEDTIVVVEGDDEGAGDTLETPALSEDRRESGDKSAAARSAAGGGAPVSLEDTFSSETAINLDQSDPVAEADFHMAYGLYDQAADLINGALAVEPDRLDLMSKLCEIYFVWGNRDAFVDAATNFKNALGDGEDGQADWDKIVIMGQQIAGDAPLFSGARAGAAQAVDLDFEASGEVDAGLDIDFDSGGEDDDVIDLGADEQADADDDGLDFDFGDSDEDTGGSITQEMPERFGDDDSTVESPTLESTGIDSDDTVEQPAGGLESTSELPSLDSDDIESQLSGLADSGDATAEIDLDDLGLDLDGLAGDLDDDNLLSDDEPTGTSLSDDLAETGRNPQIPSDDDDVDVTVENALLDATGQTQVLPDDFAIETSTNLQVEADDDGAEMLPPESSDDPEFDFSETEALPKDSFDADDTETTESPAMAGSTDMDLDLDDLTAALKLSDAGDTVDQARDDATVEQPRPGGDDDLDLDFDLGADEPTQQLGPDDVSDDLRDARTMTEVGTKLDLARAYVDMGDPGGARNILEEVLEEGDESQRQQAKQLLDTLPD